jgi:cysteinyl-tRNA synthetase
LVAKLQFYNSFSREIEDLTPMTGRLLRIYVCGPTVYDAPHLGHARSAVVYDVFRRFFNALDYDVALVRNITDIDDKIILKAQAAGRDYRTIADRYQNEYDTVMTVLNVQAPHAAPRATEYIGTCQELVARMLHNGHAYRSGKAVYLAIRSCRDYGRLSGQSCGKIPEITRCREQPGKRHPGDFALWKEAKTGEPQWPSPWGPGRPGWHIECTAMSHALLNTPFDIHGGGRDLIFPHHENEIAQSIAAFGKPPAAMWLHHGMVTVGQAKMAKSKGNAPPLEALLQTYPPEAVRLFLLSRHYRRDLPFTESALQESTAQLDRIYALARRLQAVFGRRFSTPCRQSFLWQRFARHLASDGNVTGGMATLFETARELNRTLDTTVSNRYGTLWRTTQSTGADWRFICRDILGVLHMTAEAYDQARRKIHGPVLSRTAIERLVVRRQAARKGLDWGTADGLRAILEQNGVHLQDKDHETLWRHGKQQGRITAETQHDDGLISICQSDGHPSTDPV